MISFRFPLLLYLVILSAAYTKAHTPPDPSFGKGVVDFYVSPEQTEGRAASRRKDGNSDDLDLYGRSRKEILADRATAAWNKHGLCSPMEYWQPTPESMKESNAKDFMLKWLDENGDGKGPAECKTAELTAMRCFASLWWGDYDFRCPIHNLEQCAAPRPGDIVRWIRGKYEDWPTSQVVDIARKVFFVYKTFEIAMSDLKADLDAIRVAETVVALESHTLVNTFTPGFSRTRDAHCKFAKAVTQVAVDTVIQLGIMSINQGSYGGPLAEMATAAERFAMAAKKLQGNKEMVKLAIRAAQKAHLAKNSLYYAQAGIGLSRKGQQAGEDLRNAYYVEKGSKVQPRPPQLEYPLVKGHGTCGNIFGVIDDTSASQTDHLVTFINMHLLTIGYTIEQLFDSFFIKDSEDLGDLALIEVMKFDGWTGKSTRVYGNVVQEVKAAIANTMVSELLAASRQYIKCEERDDAQEVCKEDRNLPPSRQVGLFCPETYPRLRCQAGYWTKKQLFNSEKNLPALHGKDSFAGFGMDLEALFLNSIDRYYIMGTDAYSPRGLWADGQIVEPSKMGHLPVAVSRVRTIYPSLLRHHFPFSCGNWASNCTSAFINRINVDIQDEWELRSLELVTHLQQIPEPANRFLLLCNLGVRWPKSPDGVLGLDKSGPSIICDRLKKEIAHKDEIEGNYRFCTMDIVREHVFKHEQASQYSLLGTNPSHKKLCAKWMLDNSIKIQKLFE